jgi:hypothetical protein
MKHTNRFIDVASLRQGQPVPNAGYWDRVLVATIFIAMVGFAYAVFASSLLQPIITAAQKQQWNVLLFRPTVIWVAMGFLLLLLRTIL